MMIVFNHWFTDIQCHHHLHPDLENCIDPILCLLLSIWKAALSPDADTDSRETVAAREAMPLSADEREEVDYAVVRQGRRYSTVDIVGLVQQQFHSIPNFHENYESLQAALGDCLDDIVKGFRDARLQRIRSLDSRLNDLLSHSDVAPIMKAVVQPHSHGFGYSMRIDKSSPSDHICPKIISFLQFIVVGPSASASSFDPTQPESMPAFVETVFHPHTLEKRQSVYQSGRYTCDVCSSSGVGWVFHCQQCGWDAHPSCVAPHFSDVAQPRSATEVETENASVLNLLKSCRAKFFDPKCAWLTCACDELTFAFSQSTSLAEKLKTFLCQVMNIVSGDGNSARYQILHSLACATVKSQSRNVIWGLSGVLLHEISKDDVRTCFMHLDECRSTDDGMSINFAAKLASSFSLLLIHITASLLEYATMFDITLTLKLPTSSFLADPEPMGSTATKRLAFVNIGLYLVWCIQVIFELGVQGEILPIDSMCRCFIIPGRYLAINRHVNDKAISLTDALIIISEFSSKLIAAHGDSAPFDDSHFAMPVASFGSALGCISAASATIRARTDPSDFSEWAVLKAVEYVIRLLSTKDLVFMKQACYNLESSQENNAPFLRQFFQNNSVSSQQSIVAYCEFLLTACLREMTRVISTLDIITLANDFIVCGLVEALSLLLSDKSASQMPYLPLANRRRIFYKIMCETQKTAADPSSAFLRFIDLLKSALEDQDTQRTPTSNTFSTPALRVVLHDLSARCEPLSPQDQHTLHGCECVFSKNDTQFLPKLLDALNFNDKRLLPRASSFGYLPFGADRREQGFTQTLSFQDAQDWIPLQQGAAAPARMWLCRLKCPPFNIEGRRMFVKAKGVIGCGHNGCGDEKKFDYSMCQACSTSYKLQSPDFSTALELFSTSLLSDVIVMLPHQTPTSSEAIVNRAGAAVKPGNLMVIYCGRKLGKDQIPGSNGVCGPSSGPQCADCAYSFPIDPKMSAYFSEGSQSHHPFGSVPFSRNPWIPSHAPRFPGQQLVSAAFGAAHAQLSPSELLLLLQQDHQNLMPQSSVFGVVAPGLHMDPQSLAQPATAEPTLAPDLAVVSQLVEQMGFNRNAATRAAVAGIPMICDFVLIVLFLPKSQHMLNI
jgi:hypothetical protein